MYVAKVQLLQLVETQISIFQMVDGFVPNAKTTISVAEQSAIDVKKLKQNKILMVSLSIS